MLAERRHVLDLHGVADHSIALLHSDCTGVAYSVYEAFLHKATNTSNGHNTYSCTTCSSTTIRIVDDPLVGLHDSTLQSTVVHVVVLYALLETRSLAAVSGYPCWLRALELIKCLYRCYFQGLKLFYSARLAQLFGWQSSHPCLYGVVNTYCGKEYSLHQAKH